MKRGILIGSGVIVLAIAGVFFFAISSLDSLIKEAVEKYGSEVTKAEVRLDKVQIDISSGKGSLNGLNIGNPKGFETPSAFKLGEISVSIDTSSITSDPVVIKEIVIGSPEVTYELSSSGSNIEAIQNNVNAYIAKLGGGGKSAPKKDEGGGPKLVIENLYVKGGMVNVSATILKGKAVSAPLPDIHLKDIGKDEGGATPSEVAEELLTSLNQSASKAVSGLGIGKTLDSLKQHLAGTTEGVGKAVGGAVESASETARSIGDSASEAAEGVGKKLKGLLGN